MEGTGQKTTVRIEGEATNWQGSCDELLAKFDPLVKRAPTAIKGDLEELRDRLLWTLTHAPVPPDQRYTATAFADAGGATRPAAPY